MDGWYVMQLLLDKESIREGIVSYHEDGKNIGYDENAFNLVNFDDETYLDLLTVESKLKELIDKKLISKKEILIADLVLSNKSFTQLEKESNFSRQTISKLIKQLCSKIAYYLGGHFTNEGFIYYMENKYKLNEEQIELVKKYIN